MRKYTCQTITKETSKRISGIKHRCIVYIFTQNGNKIQIFLKIKKHDMDSRLPQNQTSFNTRILPI